MSKRIGKYYYYSGAMHIHTTASDGTKPIEDIIALGREVGLDFMLFSDHMNLSNRRDSVEGYHGHTLVLVGYEHNDPDDKNHYLIFNSPGVYPKDAEASEYVKQAAADKALGIIAHPDERRSPTGKYPPYPWLDWTVEDFDGIELWNQMSEWMERLTRWNKLAMAFSPRKSMVGPTERTLKIWDDINMKRRCAGVAGVDAHGFPIRVGFRTVTIFPYKVHFKCLRTHLILDNKLSKDSAKAKQQLYRAIRDCRVFFSNMRWGVADSFVFKAVQGEKEAVSGDNLDFNDDTNLKIKIPRQAIIKIIANGQKVLEVISDRLEYKVTQPGIYRVEVWRKKRGWIFSNHIRIGV